MLHYIEILLENNKYFIAYSENMRAGLYLIHSTGGISRETTASIFQQGTEAMHVTGTHG